MIQIIFPFSLVHFLNQVALVAAPFGGGGFITQKSWLGRWKSLTSQYPPWYRWDPGHPCFWWRWWSQRRVLHVWCFYETLWYGQWLLALQDCDRLWPVHQPDFPLLWPPLPGSGRSWCDIWDQRNSGSHKTCRCRWRLCLREPWLELDTLHVLAIAVFTSARRPLWCVTTNPETKWIFDVRRSVSAWISAQGNRWGISR